jgi:uncharacterized membrane protein
MRKRSIDLLALFLLMLTTGVFWGTWFTLTRKLETFSAPEFIHIGQTIISNVAVPMRIILPSCILFMFISLWMADNKKSGAFKTGILSLVLVIGVLLVTLIVLVPIDNQIRDWTEATVPAEWTGMRSTWNTFHRIRTWMALAAFGCFSYFLLLSDPNPSNNH